MYVRAAWIGLSLLLATLGCERECLDGDGDGFGFGSDCRGADCNDAAAEINPGRSEVAYDGIDQDCDGRDLWDADGDGQTAIAAPFGERTDCDDADPKTYLGAGFNEP